MLTQMVNAIAHTRSVKWLAYAVALLDQEYDWFDRQHLVPQMNLSRYLPFDATPLPRPESYREDESVVEGMTLMLRNFTLGALTGGAESGWDFSSRWIRSNGVNLRNITTQSVLPVCLNSILYSNERILADLHSRLSFHAASSSSSSASSSFYNQTSHFNHNLKSQSYTQRAQQRANAMRAHMWSPPPLSLWHDSCVTPPCPQLTSAYASSIMPLWAGLGLGPGGSSAAVVAFVSRLLRDGGVATSTVNSGLQWDGDNAWPPLQLFASAALRSLEDAAATRVAVKVEQTYLRAAQYSWKMNGTLFEKYSAVINGATGEGGEYVPQTGFGWSAGVAAVFILADIQTLSPSVIRSCSSENAAWMWSCWSSAAQIGIICAVVLTVVVCLALAKKWVSRRSVLERQLQAGCSDLQPLLLHGDASR